MSEKYRREQFLRERGSFSDSDKRRRFVQQQELRARIDWLQDHIKRFTGYEDKQSAVLRSAWRRELIAKKELLWKLEDGQFVSRDEVGSHVNSAEVIQKAHYKALNIR